MRYALSIPKAASLILKHDLNAPLDGLDTVDRAELAAGGHRLLVVPHHGRTGRPDAGAGGLQRSSHGSAAQLYEWRALHRFALRDGAGGLCRRDRRLGDDRGRPPALHSLWPAADRGLGLAARRACRCGVAARVHRRLFRRVRRRNRLHLEAHGPRRRIEARLVPKRKRPVRAAGITPGPALDAARMIGREGGREA